MSDGSDLLVPSSSAAESIPSLGTPLKAFLSPVQESRIDFLLEEEFTCNPDFLSWFLLNVERVSQDEGRRSESSMILDAHAEWDCSSVRSATTNDGETDVLVVYRASGDTGRVAILIEDKIRAGFQPEQAERYRKRGKDGKDNGEWAHYWTCLVAPRRYSARNHDFDARISLEKIRTFFDSQDRRSLFKASVIDRAVNHFEQTGVRVVDKAMTAYRAFYACRAEAAFDGTGVRWPVAREAWWGDQWFRFAGGAIPAGAEIIYKSSSGFVDLAFSKTDEKALQKVFARSMNPDPLLKLHTQQTHKSASLRIQITPVSDFSDPIAAESIMDDSLRQVKALVAFCELNRSLLSELAAVGSVPEDGS